jgi:hypothetical protein
VIQNRLAGVTVYQTQDDAWRPIQIRFGLTAGQVSQALAAGSLVPRPSLMDPLRPEPEVQSYVFDRDFGTNMRKLRQVAQFAVPAPGPLLAGLRLADAALVRVRGPGHAVDSGYVAGLTYSADPDQLGTGERELTVSAASPRLGAGANYAAEFSNGSARLVGPGYDARLTGSGSAILRYHRAYVLVAPNWGLPSNQWRPLLSRIGRS